MAAIKRQTQLGQFDLRPQVDFIQDRGHARVHHLIPVLGNNVSNINKMSDGQRPAKQAHAHLFKFFQQGIRALDYPATSSTFRRVLSLLRGKQCIDMCNRMRRTGTGSSIGAARQHVAKRAATARNA